MKDVASGRRSIDRITNWLHFVFEQYFGSWKTIYYRRGKKNDLLRLGNGEGQWIVTCILDQQFMAEVVIPATDGDGNFCDKANSICYIVSVLMKIWKQAQPAGTMQDHACNNQQAYQSPYHGWKIGYGIINSNFTVKCVQPAWFFKRSVRVRYRM